MATNTSVPSIALDTGVLIEYIDENGSFHEAASTILENVTSGKIAGFVPNVVFAELFYVSAKLYEELEKKKHQNVESPEVRAEKLIRWLFNSPNILMPENSLELTLRAGIIKKKYSIALPDSYVLACAQLNSCKAVFRAVEEEMERENKLERLKEQEKIELLFLQDYS